MDYLLAGDATAAPLLARLPDSLLCRHTAAVGAELLAFRSRVRDALAAPTGSAAAPAWAEIPEAAQDGAADAGGEGAASRSASPVPDDINVVNSIGVDGGSLSSASMASRGAGSVAAPAAADLVATPFDLSLVGEVAGQFTTAGGAGGDGEWLAIEVGGDDG